MVSTNPSAPNHSESTLASPYAGTTPYPTPSAYSSSPFPGQTFPGQGPSPTPPQGPSRRPGPTSSSIAAMVIAAVLLVLAAGAVTVALTTRGSGGNADRAQRAGSVDAASTQTTATPPTTPPPAPVTQPTNVLPPPTVAVPTVPVVLPAPVVVTAPVVTQPPYPDVDVSPGAIADRFDGYLSAASGFDVDGFVRQWAYPVQSYYGNKGVSASFVADKARTYFGKYRAISFTRVGEPQIALGGGVVQATAPFHFEYVNPDGSMRCGTNTITITLNRTPGLPISAISERQGPQGC